METLKLKNGNLQEKQKEMLLQMYTLKKERDEASVIKETLDGKLSLALAKAEQVPALQIDAQMLDKKITVQQNNIEQLKTEVQKGQRQTDEWRKRHEETKKKLDALPKQTEVAPSAAQSQTSKLAIKARQLGAKHTSRHSRQDSFFRNLKESGFDKVPKPDHSRQQSQYNTGQMVQQLQNSED